MQPGKKISAYYNVDEYKCLDASEFKKTRVGVYGIAIKDKKILAVRVHPNGENNADKVYLANPLWDFPGGGIEPGENVVDALKREFMEEAGTEPIIKRLWHVGQAHYCNGAAPLTNVQIYYLVDVKSEELAPHNEALEVAWKELSFFSRQNSLPGLYQVIDKLRESNLN